MLRCKTKLDLV